VTLTTVPAERFWKIVSPAAVHRLVDLLRDVLDQVREGADPRLPLELALVRVCRPATELSIDALAQHPG